MIVTNEVDKGTINDLKIMIISDISESMTLTIKEAQLSEGQTGHFYTNAFGHIFQAGIYAPLIHCRNKYYFEISLKEYFDKLYNNKIFIVREGKIFESCISRPINPNKDTGMTHVSVVELNKELKEISKEDYMQLIEIVKECMWLWMTY